MSSNLTGFSRKSGVSMLNMDSITSISSGKLPGERGLKAAAERRQEKAKMAQIDQSLRKLHNTDDLNYAGEEESSKQIDSITLARLIDECKEEQE